MANYAPSIRDSSLQDLAEYIEENQEDNRQNIGSSIIWFSKADLAIKSSYEWLFRTYGINGSKKIFIESKAKDHNIDYSLRSARKQMLCGAYHFARVLCTKEDSEERQYQLNETEKHFRRAIVYSFQSCIEEMIGIVEFAHSYYEKNGVSLSEKLSTYPSTRNKIDNADSFLKEDASNRSKKEKRLEYIEYYKHFYSLKEDINIFLNNNDAFASEEKRLKKSQKRWVIATTIAIITAVIALCRFLTGLPVFQ